jgi:hypothetical protein
VGKHAVMITGGRATRACAPLRVKSGSRNPQLPRIPAGC